MSDYAKFRESVKTASEHFKKASENSLSCVKNPFILKAQKASRYRGTLELCPKPYRNRECQAPVNGRVFCMAENPCWRVET